MKSNSLGVSTSSRKAKGLGLMSARGDVADQPVDGVKEDITVAGIEEVPVAGEVRVSEYNQRGRLQPRDTIWRLLVQRAESPESHGRVEQTGRLSELGVVSNWVLDEPAFRRRETQRGADDGRIPSILRRLPLALKWVGRISPLPPVAPRRRRPDSRWYRGEQ